MLSGGITMRANLNPAGTPAQTASATSCRMMCSHRNPSVQARRRVLCQVRVKERDRLLTASLPDPVVSLDSLVAFGLGSRQIVSQTALRDAKWAS